MNAIAYSLFGLEDHNPNSFSFETYLSGLLICVRQNRLLYPDWITVLHTDDAIAAMYAPLFNDLPIKWEYHPKEPLTKAMLWRLLPVFNQGYERVICRDLDSPATYREAQCVKYWEMNNKAAHAITDSVSHNIPMMGGMIGFVNQYFANYTGLLSWQQMFDGCPYDFTQKGSDQTLINKIIYPKFAKHGEDSITQHYLLGMPNTFLSDYHNEVPNIELHVPNEGFNDVAGHIGAAGCYLGPLQKLGSKYPDLEMQEIEQKYPKIAYWQ